MAESKNISAPWRGLNLRDRLEDIGPEYASVLDNVYPDRGETTMRRGSQPWVQDLPSDVNTLMEYSSGTSRKLFAVSGTEIYDVTVSGDLPAASVTGLTNDKFQHTMFSAGGGDFLYIVNGADGARTFDGTTWATQTITVGDATTFVNVTAHKFRLWFTQEDTLIAHFLPTSSIAGATSPLNLGPLCKHGGKIQAISNWSIDAGDGADDFLVFVTSEGECIVYQGTDPTSSDTWAMIGVYKCDRPIGRRCMVKIGADLYILTETGVVSVAMLLRLPSEQSTISMLIDPAFAGPTNKPDRTAHGWELFNFSTRSWMIVNLPQPDGSYEQYVRNAALQVPDGWFKMTGQEAKSWAMLDDLLFYGTADNVYIADTSTLDGTNVIDNRIAWGWDNYGTPQQKQWNMVRLNFQASITPSPFIEMKVDYDETRPTVQPTLIDVSAGAFWDDADWDIADWADDLTSYNQWVGLTGLGFTGSLNVVFSPPPIIAADEAIWDEAEWDVAAWEEADSYTVPAFEEVFKVFGADIAFTIGGIL